MAGSRLAVVARRQVVDHSDFMPRGAEAVDDMRADKAGSAGDEDTHREILTSKI